jgi:hypothetical protein
LHIHFEKKYDRLPEHDEKLFHEKQAVRTAEILLARREQERQDPSYNDVNIALSRTRYEHERTQDIKADVLYDLYGKQDIKPEDHLRAQLYGERLAQIEGRLYEADLKKNEPTKEPRIYRYQALQELESHKQSQKAFSEVLMQEHGLTKEVANRVTYESIRHLEKYDVMPKQESIQSYIELSQYAERRTLELKEHFKGLAPYEQERTVEFVRRREIEHVLRHSRDTSISEKPTDYKTVQDKAMNDFNLEIKQAQQQLARGNELSL